MRGTGVLSDEMANAAELTTQVARLEERVTNHIRFFWAVVAVGCVWLGWISSQVYQIRGSVNPLVAAHQLTKAASEPLDTQSQAEVLKAIAGAKKSQVPIPTPVLAEVGKSFIAASEKDQRPWQTVQALMEYRSNINSLTYVFPQTSPPPETTHFDVKLLPERSLPEVSYLDLGVPIIDAARFQQIGKATNDGVNIGPSRLMLSGGATSLDDRDIAHVNFVGVEVHYSGNPAMLEDVLFINCTFVFDNSERGRMLAENIISSRNVTFATS
jgi:hypothetical protein